MLSILNYLYDVLKRLPSNQIESIETQELKNSKTSTRTNTAAVKGTKKLITEDKRLFDQRTKVVRKADSLMGSGNDNFVKRQQYLLKNLRNQISDIPQMEGGVFNKKKIREAEIGLKRVDTALNKYEKSLKKTVRHQSIMNTRFGSFSIIMSGIAASLFVLQQAIQLIRLAVSPVTDAEKAWTKLNTTITLTTKEYKDFYATAKAADITGTIKMQDAVG